MSGEPLRHERHLWRRVAQRGVKGREMFASVNDLFFIHFVKGFDHVSLFDEVNKRKKLLLVNSLPTDL